MSICFSSASTWRSSITGCFGWRSGRHHLCTDTVAGGGLRADPASGVLYG
jgi:hypothetical protein